MVAVDNLHGTLSLNFCYICEKFRITTAVMSGCVFSLAKTPRFV